MDFDEAMQFMMSNPGKAVNCPETGVTLAYTKPYFNPEEYIAPEGSDATPAPEPEDDRECFCINQRGQWFKIAPNNSFFRCEWQRVE